MKTRAVRLYGKDDLRLEEFELPGLKDDEILAKVVSNSICMSSYKAVTQADIHKRVPRDIASNPTIIGHEFAGEILEVGAKWRDAFRPGDKFSIQPALNYPDGPVGISGAPGYSYPYIGGDATYIIIPNEVMEQGCLLPYTGEGFYPASLSEPYSCVIAAMHANYHTRPGEHVHDMGVKAGGRMALLAAAGPMGLAALSYVLHRSGPRPSQLVVTDIDRGRLGRAAQLYTAVFAASRGIDLRFVDTGSCDAVASLLEISGGAGYDDVFVFAPVGEVVEQAGAILAADGCLNFFAGPARGPFMAPVDFYAVHYSSAHILGTTGGNVDDMKEALACMARGMDPAGLVTHVGGLDAVIDTTLRLPSIPGGKKLIYPHVRMPLMAISDFGKVGLPAYDALDRICRRHGGLWSVEAEAWLLSHPTDFSRQ